MTETEWLACDNPKPMLYTARASERKRRLFVIACCKRIWKYIIDERSRTAVEVAERWADGLAEPRERLAVAVAAKRAEDEFGDREYWLLWNAAKIARVSITLRGDNYFSQSDAANAAGYVAELAGVCSQQSEHLAQALLARDIFGNPFHPIIPSPSWLTSPVLALASTMYESRDFVPMPILADALEESGCDNADLLAHCRDPQGIHVRGCWVVDLVQGKK